MVQDRSNAAGLVEWDNSGITDWGAIVSAAANAAANVAVRVKITVTAALVQWPKAFCKVRCNKPDQSNHEIYFLNTPLLFSIPCFCTSARKDICRKKRAHGNGHRALSAI